MHEGFDNDFQELTTVALCQEMETFISHTKLEKSIFRSDHASNYLILKGVLGKDKQAILAQIRDASEYFKDHDIKILHGF